MIYTLNGINDSAATTTDLLAAELSELGHSNVVALRYPVTRWMQTRSRERQYNIADRLLNTIQPGCDIFAHSFGCLIAARMMELGGTDVFRRVVFMGAALDSNWTFPRYAFARLDVFYNPHDYAVRVASWFPFHPWGGMGYRGYRGKTCPKIHNHEMVSDFNIRYNHSIYFDPYYMQQIISMWQK